MDKNIRTSEGKNSDSYRSMPDFFSPDRSGLAFYKRQARRGGGRGREGGTQDKKIKIKVSACIFPRFTSPLRGGERRICFSSSAKNVNIGVSSAGCGCCPISSRTLLQSRQGSDATNGMEECSSLSPGRPSGMNEAAGQDHDEEKIKRSFHTRSMCVCTCVCVYTP